MQVVSFWHDKEFMVVRYQTFRLWKCLSDMF